MQAGGCQYVVDDLLPGSEFAGLGSPGNFDSDGSKESLMGCYDVSTFQGDIWGEARSAGIDPRFIAGVYLQETSNCRGPNNYLGDLAKRGPLVNSNFGPTNMYPRHIEMVINNHPSIARMIPADYEDVERLMMDVPWFSAILTSYAFIDFNYILDTQIISKPEVDHIQASEIKDHWLESGSRFYFRSGLLGTAWMLDRDPFNSMMGVIKTPHFYDLGTPTGGEYADPKFSSHGSYCYFGPFVNAFAQASSQLTPGMIANNYGKCA